MKSLFLFFPFLFIFVILLPPAQAKIEIGLDNHINTYIGSLGVKTGFGPLEFSVEGNWGQNWGNTPGGIGVSPPARNSSATIFNNQLDNTTTYGMWMDLACAFGPATPHLVYGQMKSKGDKNPMEYKSQFWGISIPIKMSKGLTLIPEFMWYDDGDDNRDSSNKKVDYGRYAIYGIQFLFRF